MNYIDSRHTVCRRLSGICFSSLALLLVGAGLARGQVSLVSSLPANGATDVPLNTAIVLTFSKPMDTTTLTILSSNPLFTGSLAFSANVSPTSFTPGWNPEATVLTLTYAGNLPAGALISWTINGPTAIQHGKFACSGK